jgi:hypothetical protein
VTRGTTLLCLALLCAASTASADERSLSLVAAFQESCVSEPPSFARIEAKAVAANLPVALDLGTPRQPEGPFNNTKTWIVRLATGALQLSAIEARGPAGEVTTCAITAPDALGDDVKQDLMRTFHLGPAEREAVDGDGQRRSAWFLHVHAERMVLLLIDASPSHGPGIHIHITHRLVAGS